MNATFTENSENRTAQPDRRGGRRRRRILVGIVGLGITSLLLILGTVMASNANFSKTYVSKQLVRQRITFKTVNALTDQERQSGCVVQNAGKPLTTGKQAECFANEYLGLHIQQLGNGRTYAEMGDSENAQRAQVAAAQANGDPALASLQKDLGDLTRQRELVFKAETLRGILLTSFGFSVLGEKGAQAATVAYSAAGVMALLSVAALVFGLATPKAATARSERSFREPPLVGAGRGDRSPGNVAPRESRRSLV